MNVFHKGGVGEIIAAILLVGIVVAIIISSVIPLLETVDDSTNSTRDTIIDMDERVDIQ